MDLKDIVVAVYFKKRKAIKPGRISFHSLSVCLSGSYFWPWFSLLYLGSISLSNIEDEKNVCRMKRRSRRGRTRRFGKGGKKKIR